MVAMRRHYGRQAPRPGQLNPVSIGSRRSSTVARSSFTEKQLGQAMGAFMKEHGANVDAATANQLLKQKLAGR